MDAALELLSAASTVGGYSLNDTELQSIIIETSLLIWCRALSLDPSYWQKLRDCLPRTDLSVDAWGVSCLCLLYFDFYYRVWGSV